MRRKDGIKAISIFVGLFIALYVISTMSYTETASALPSPLAWYDFNHNTKDITGNGHDATAYYTEYNGTGIELNGVNAYIVISDVGLEPQELTLHINITPLERWDSETEFVPIIEKERSDRLYYADGYEIIYDNGMLCFGLARSYYARYRESVCTPITMDAYKSYNITATKNATMMRLYVDGELKAEKNVNFYIYYGADDIKIGKAYMLRKYWYAKMYVEELRIYGLRLSDTEVKRLAS